MAEQLSSFDGDRFCVTAPPYRSTPEEIEAYIFHFWENECRLNSASIVKKLSWEVYLISKGFLEHYSIGFVPPRQPDKCFVIHLMVIGDKSRFVLTMIDLRALSRTANLEVTKLGDVSDISAKTIFHEGYVCFTKMGDYHAVWNNCQHYCQKLAKKFHLNQPVMTSNDAVGGAVLVGGSLSLLGYALYKLFADDKSDDTTKQHIN